MKTDIYTKFILTIIALSLVWICARDVNFVRPARAASAPPTQEIVITGVKIALKDGSGAPITDINGKPMFTWELPVHDARR